jgi:exodeoxyribonuclease-3
MRIISLNANGIRSAQRKGVFDWLKRSRADVLCIQETKAQMHQLGEEIISPKGFISYFNDAKKKGYSGVAIYSRKRPDKVSTTLGWHHADHEGRFIQADFGAVSIISLYLPSGTSGDERQDIKFDFMEKFMPRLKAMGKSKRQYILCGDWNIAHKEIDLKNWRSNQKNSGFLPEEREWMNSVFNNTGLIDAFRQIDDRPDQYTWWSNRGRAWEKNVGWRIDYHVVSASLKDKIKKARIFKEKRFSDHAPLIIDYDIDI